MTVFEKTLTPGAPVPGVAGPDGLDAVVLVAGDWGDLGQRRTCVVLAFVPMLVQPFVVWELNETVSKTFAHTGDYFAPDELATAVSAFETRRRAHARRF
jgi:hypothetical protein